ncbi:MAG: AAA-like domain-containing protein, partial [Bernardetiaceae bacterium]|nr:AAA-like domain-containing protein [Bernardetiaceae bacterium]
MKKRFNVTGTCRREEHYMMDERRRVGEALEMIERGEYFVIHRPRQFGKTTLLRLLASELGRRQEYQVILLNFQGIDAQSHQSDGAFAQTVVEELARYFEFADRSIYQVIASEWGGVKSMNELSLFITR